MYKLINLFLFTIIMVFFFNIYSYYSSDKNIKNINFNRININENIRDKIKNIPILENNTKDIIKFNTSLGEDIKKNDSRNFWNLLKSK